ncbi:MAG: response regulator [Burkholderiales bacterium]|jgi:DNA-binding NarL/FixJ family response regulator
MSICGAPDIETGALDPRRAVGRPPSILIVHDALPGLERVPLESVDRRRPAAPHFDCRSIAEAVDAARCTRFDLVLLDPGLPDAVGMHGVRAMRDALPDAWIAVVSGLLDPRAARACLEAGASDAVAATRLSVDALERLMARCVRHRGRREPAPSSRPG